MSCNSPAKRVPSWRSPFPQSHSLFFAALVGGAVLAAPFPVLDASNRALCALMLLSLAALTSFGLPHLALGPALQRTAWRKVLPAVPVMVLTLGFHVITPLICSVLGGRIAKIRQAILVGGAVPLVMVLAWNTTVLGLAKEVSSAWGRAAPQLLRAVA